MKRHHNLDNEITGEYYKEEPSVRLINLVNFAVGAGVTALILEWTGLADYLLGSLMN